VTRWLVLPLAALAAGGGPLLRVDPVPRVHTVEIRGMTFHPDTLTVTRGDTIVWVNRDMVPHTATAVTDPPWDTGQLAHGAAGRYVPPRAGITDYLCRFHPTMRATLIVKEPL
jgi:plastocyanin